MAEAPGPVQVLVAHLLGSQAGDIPAEVSCPTKVVNTRPNGGRTKTLLKVPNGKTVAHVMAVVEALVQVPVLRLLGYLVKDIAAEV